MCGLGEDCNTGKGKNKRKKQTLLHKPEMVIQLMEVLRKNADMGDMKSVSLF